MTEDSTAAIHCRAPLRVSFGGGGTDVPPYPSLFGGAVLSCTIDLYAYATVRATSGRSSVQSPDLVAAAALSGRRRLGHSVVSTFEHNARVVLGCDAPPGSGLGASSSLGVALCAAMAELSHRPLSPYELATQALRVEREELCIPGGMQDHYAAAFGGWNFIEFGAEDVRVNPVRLRPDVRAELQGSLLLLPTPSVSRRSSGILRRQVAAYERKDEDVLDALATIKAHAAAARDAVVSGDLGALAAVLDDGWRTKRRLASGIATDEIDELYRQARALGVTGGKLLGAGGGGFLLLMVPFDRRGHVVRELRARGHEPVNFAFVDEGAHAWRALASE
jgi:D-glycero-alpha-D-manno-heptose-7-phosphate kinase